jgi:SAM-dependent methyltransferase
MAMTFTDAKQRFSNRVTDYVRYRPAYPAGILELLRKDCGLRPQHLIADLGSGTGLLSKLFLDHGNRVFGVEPNAEMRAAGEEFLQEYANFTSLAGSAEATTLPDRSVDFITAGQAFHWFDLAAASREFRRILKRGGWVVVVWQERRLQEKQFTRGYEDMLERYGIDYKNVKEAYPEPAKMRQFYELGTFHWQDLPNHQFLDWEGVSGRLRSSSFVPTENHPNYQPMMDELRKIFLAHEQNGLVRMDYFARLYFGHLDRN